MRIQVVLFYGKSLNEPCWFAKFWACSQEMTGEFFQDKADFSK